MCEWRPEALVTLHEADDESEGRHNMASHCVNTSRELKLWNLGSGIFELVPFGQIRGQNAATAQTRNIDCR